MGNILTWGCKVKPRRVPNMWPISETGSANILNQNSLLLFTNLQMSQLVPNNMHANV